MSQILTLTSQLSWLEVTQDLLTIWLGYIVQPLIEDLILVADERRDNGR